MKIKMTKLAIILCSLSSLGLTSAYSLARAQEYHQLIDITETASNYVNSEMPKEYVIESLSAGKIDSRIKLKKCQQALIPFVSGSFKVNSNMTIGVKCVEPEWKYYVALKVVIVVDTVVANTTILKGEYISADKLSLISQKISGQQNRYFRAIKDIAGKIAKRTIRPNTPITANQLQIRYLVKRKQQVIIVAKNSNLMVKMKGISLENGRNNETIKVKNINSNKIIQGVVSAEGVVTVNF